MIGLLQWLDPPWPAPPPATEVAYGMPIFVVESDDAALVAKRAAELHTLCTRRPTNGPLGAPRES